MHGLPVDTLSCCFGVSMVSCKRLVFSMFSGLGGRKCRRCVFVFNKFSGLGVPTGVGRNVIVVCGGLEAEDDGHDVLLAASALPGPALPGSGRRSVHTKAIIIRYNIVFVKRNMRHGAAEQRWRVRFRAGLPRFPAPGRSCRKNRVARADGTLACDGLTPLFSFGPPHASLAPAFLVESAAPWRHAECHEKLPHLFANLRRRHRILPA